MDLLWVVDRSVISHHRDLQLSAGPVCGVHGDAHLGLGICRHLP